LTGWRDFSQKPSGNPPKQTLTNKQQEKDYAPMKTSIKLQTTTLLVIPLVLAVLRSYQGRKR
jgi:hypothetical protein